MLQTVLGIDAARIARAFLVPAATMGQRLVRAKAKIHDAGIRFAVPDRDVLPERLDDVLNAIYAAYGTGWDAVGGADEHATGLAREGIYLARLVVTLLPDEPEALGLLALLLHCEARLGARRTASGAFVPLDRQDTSLWDRAMIDEAEGLLAGAARHRRFGRFQCEAAIQSIHAERGLTGRRDLAALQSLYDLLWERTGSLGAAVARAAVICDRDRTEDALAALDALPGDRIERHQPYWVVRARVLKRLQRQAEAEMALSRALDLTEDPAVLAFLIEESDRVTN
jgi:RNA polymerase sigma-70 factor (ECF subfamily)